MGVLKLHTSLIYKHKATNIQLRTYNYEQKYPEIKQAIRKAFEIGGYTLDEIGEYFGIHYSTVSRIVNKSA